MKHILLLAAIFALVFGSTAARLERGTAGGSVVKSIADNVPGAIIDGWQASTKAGYEFAPESRNSVSVIKTGGRGSARLQTGSLMCVSAGKGNCDAFIVGGRSNAVCKDRERCHFVGIRGGVRAP
jgi:hypothetical protein